MFISEVLIRLYLCKFTQFINTFILIVILHEEQADLKNNHNMYTINLEKEHYMQDRVNLKNDQMTMNCTSYSNASSKMIASNVDMLQENSDVRL